MITSQKHLFDIPDDVSYLACAAMSPLLKTVRHAGSGGLDRKFHPWDFERDILEDESENLRLLFARLIGAQTEDIAIVPSASYGVATAATNLRVGAGRNIVILQDQFPSNVYSWLRLAGEYSGRVVVVARPPDWDWTTAVLAKITPQTDVVSLPPCHWLDGSALDLARIGRRCREIGAAFVVDATQAVGAMAIDLADWQPDYLMCSGYKWLMCPYSISFLYVAPHRQNDQPLEIHGQNRGFGSTPDGGIDYFTGYMAGARRFDMGERTNFINLPMAVAGLEQVNAWGSDNIQQTLTPLTQRVAREACDRGWSCPDDAHRVGHIIGITPPFAITDQMVADLESAGVYVTRRGSGLRIAPHVYNNLEDINRLYQTIDRLWISG